jgi:hypothetical protein
MSSSCDIVIVGRDLFATGRVLGDFSSGYFVHLVDGPPQSKLSPIRLHKMFFSVMINKDKNFARPFLFEHPFE